MYGGLFGDLPAAKGETGVTKKEESQSTGSVSDPSPSNNAAAAAAASTTTAASATTATAVAATGLMIPPALKKSKIGGSLAQSIGTAGTSMAFIPTTIQRKKNHSSKVSTVSKSPPPPSTTMMKPVPATTTTDVNNSEFSTTNATTSTSNSLFGSSTVTIVETVPQQGPVDIHAPHYQQQQQQQSIDGTAIPPSTSHALPTNLLDGAWNSRIPMDDDDEEDDDDTNDNGQITDPYDPRVPNDLLEYWDRQAIKAEQWQLEQETKRSLEQQQVLRERLEEERQELLQLQQRQPGNLVQFDSATGRGRGVSNLPAWLVAQQQQQKEQQEQQQQLQDPLGDSV
jgi:hypothetical protein